MEPAMKDALKSMLDNAYDNLKKYTQGLYEAQSKAVEAKTAYELAKAAKIVSGAIQGKNETERKAAEATVLAMEIDAVKTAEKDETLQRLLLNLAQLEVDRARWTIRLELGVIVSDI